MSSAPEVEIVAALNADTSLATVGKLYLNQWPRGNRVKLPLTTVQLISDDNAKRSLARYGGSAALQFDIYNKADTPELREDLKAALRRLRGTVGQLTSVWAVVTNEINQGPDETGTWRYTVEATVNWEG